MIMMYRVLYIMVLLLSLVGCLGVATEVPAADDAMGTESCKSKPESEGPCPPDGSGARSGGCPESGTTHNCSPGTPDGAAATCPTKGCPVVRSSSLETAEPAGAAATECTGSGIGCSLSPQAEAGPKGDRGETGPAGSTTTAAVSPPAVNQVQSTPTTINTAVEGPAAPASPAPIEKPAASGGNLQDPQLQKQTEDTAQSEGKQTTVTGNGNGQETSVTASHNQAENGTGETNNSANTNSGTVTPSAPHVASGETDGAAGGQNQANGTGITGEEVRAAGNKQSEGTQGNQKEPQSSSSTQTSTSNTDSPTPNTRSNEESTTTTTTTTTTLPSSVPTNSNNKKPNVKGDADSSSMSSSLWVRVPLLMVVALACILV